MDSAVDFAAGWVSGAAGIVTTQPLDSVLVRVQAAPAGATGSLTSTSRGLALSGGLRAFWRGATPMLWSVPAQNALLFAGYGVGLGWCEREEDSNSSSDNPPLWHVFAGGCMGGFIQSFIMSPVELVKIRLQLAEAEAVGTSGVKAGAGSIALVTGVVRSFGMIGLLSRGLGPTMGRDVVPHGVWFATYEACKRKFSEREGVRACDNGALSAGSQLTAGGVAATAAWIVGYPFDVIKTRVQGDCTENGRERSFMWRTVKNMMRQDGVRVFYRGLGLKLARAVPMSMIGFFAYEETARELRRLISSRR